VDFNFILFSFLYLLVCSCWNMMRIWRETWYVDKHMYLNQAKCELKKGSALLSPTLVRTHLLVMFIYREVASWSVPQGVPCFVNGTPPEYITDASRRPASSDWAWAWPRNPLTSAPHFVYKYTISISSYFLLLIS
jgi:hypothetical protein